MSRRVYWYAFLIICLFIWPINVQGQDTREELKETINELQNRLMEIEGKMKQIDKEGQTTKLEKRVMEMEQNLAPYEDPYTFRAYWKDGLNMETRDKEFKMKIFGRIMNDWTWQFANDTTDNAINYGIGAPDALEDGTEFRRARLGMSGEIYERVIFKGEWDWAGGDADFKDVYLGVQDIPYVGKVTVGHQKEPFGLEELTSSKYITFMERAPVFAPSRNTGIEVRNNAFDEHMQWQIGAYRETDDYGDSGNGSNSVVSGDGEYVVTGRITGLPWCEEKGRELVHLGVSASRRSPHDDEERYRERPTVHQTARLIDTGFTDKYGTDVFYNKIYLVGTEAALVYGPFSMQGEWAIAMNDRFEREWIDDFGNYKKPGDDVDYRAWYIYGSYFLTGENRTYKPSYGAFDKIKPRDNLYDKKTGWGLGAWEVALRYNNVDLDDEGVNGGELDNITFGVNWYLNPNTRVMFNYVTSDLDRELSYNDPPESNTVKQFDTGSYHAYMMRFQIYW